MKIFALKSGKGYLILYQVSSTFCEKSLIRQTIGYLLAAIGGGCGQTNYFLDRVFSLDM